MTSIDKNPPVSIQTMVRVSDTLIDELERTGKLSYAWASTDTKQKEVWFFSASKHPADHFEAINKLKTKKPTVKKKR